MLECIKEFFPDTYLKNKIFPTWHFRIRYSPNDPFLSMLVGNTPPLQTLPPFASVQTQRPILFWFLLSCLVTEGASVLFINSQCLFFWGKVSLRTVPLLIWKQKQNSKGLKFWIVSCWEFCFNKRYLGKTIWKGHLLSN